MRVPEEQVCVHLFRQKPVFTSLLLKSPVHVHRLRIIVSVSDPNAYHAELIRRFFFYINADPAPEIYLIRIIGMKVKIL